MHHLLTVESIGAGGGGAPSSSAAVVIALVCVQEELLVEVHFVVSVEPVEDIQQEGAAQLLFVTVHQ